MADSFQRGTATPAGLPPLDLAERDLRLDRLWRRMRELEFSALVLTSEPNFRYVMNFRSPTWVTTTRPRYLVVPLDDLPTAIVPSSNAVVARLSGWVSDIKFWPAPRPDDEGISLLLECLRKFHDVSGKIGFELGSGSRLGFAVSDFLRVMDVIGRDRIADAAPLMDEIRAIKSVAEVARHRAAAQAASGVMSGVATIGARCRTTAQLHREVQVALLTAGLDRVPYLVCAAGPGGYVATNLEPDDRAYSPNDIIYLDVGATVDGYFCDFNRHLCFAATDDATMRAYANVYAALDVGIAAAKPGRPISHIWTAMAGVLDARQQRGTGIGRFGHAIGLSLTEWPSIAPHDDTLLQPGMVLAIEPSISYSPAHGQCEQRVMVLEENVVITQEGAELLTLRAPPEMPILH
jgi:Xaa-Pro aminopeptidase